MPVLPRQLTLEVVGADLPQREAAEQRIKHQDLAVVVHQGRHTVRRAERSASRQRQVEPQPEVRADRGTGQGMTIVRSAAQKHGGTIDFQSTVGLGTKFVLRLPLEPPA